MADLVKTEKLPVFNLADAHAGVFYIVPASIHCVDFSHFGSAKVSIRLKPAGIALGNSVETAQSIQFVQR